MKISPVWVLFQFFWRSLCNLFVEVIASTAVGCFKGMVSIHTPHFFIQGLSFLMMKKPWLESLDNACAQRLPEQGDETLRPGTRGPLFLPYCIILVTWQFWVWTFHAFPKNHWSVGCPDCSGKSLSMPHSGEDTPLCRARPAGCLRRDSSQLKRWRWEETIPDQRTCSVLYRELNILPSFWGRWFHKAIFQDPIMNQRHWWVLCPLLTYFCSMSSWQNCSVAG